MTHDSETEASDSLFGSLEDSVNSQYDEQPRIESPMSPLSAAVMNAVDPQLVSPGISVNTGPRFVKLLCLNQNFATKFKHFAFSLDKSRLVYG